MDPGGSPTISVIVPLSYIANAIIAGGHKPRVLIQFILIAVWGPLSKPFLGLETPSIDPGFVNQKHNTFQRGNSVK